MEQENGVKATAATIINLMKQTCPLLETSQHTASFIIAPSPQPADLCSKDDRFCRAIS
jgi:hypothetical protein